MTKTSDTRRRTTAALKTSCLWLAAAMGATAPETAPAAPTPPHAMAAPTPAATHGAGSMKRHAKTASLRRLAADKGKHIGVALPVGKMRLDDDSDSATALVADNFNLVVAENEMKYDATEPKEGVFDFRNGDKLTDFAARHGMRVRGHTLVWHSQLPRWLTADGKENTRGLSRDSLLALMQRHIDGVAGRWKGKIAEWDVVNECLDDNQRKIAGDSTAYDLRRSIWATGIGEDFIDSAFVFAHRSDPQARLFLNDYGVEFKGRRKTEALFNLAKRLKESGIPIHGVGLQCHITVGELDTALLRQNICRYADIGLDCIITELDIEQADTTADDADERQAAEYHNAVATALGCDNCHTVNIWGLTDNNSWRKKKPLIYDAAMKPKKAHSAVAEALKGLKKKKKRSRR